MLADLNVIFASALAAKPLQRGIPCEGTRRWREQIHNCGLAAFGRSNPELARRWHRRSRELTSRVPLEDPRRAQWRVEFRAYLAMSLRLYRNSTALRVRPSRAAAFASVAERLRIFGEDA